MLVEISGYLKRVRRFSGIVHERQNSATQKVPPTSAPVAIDRARGNTNTGAALTQAKLFAGKSRHEFLRQRAFGALLSVLARVFFFLPSSRIHGSVASASLKLSTRVVPGTANERSLSSSLNEYKLSSRHIEEDRRNYL